MNIEQITDLYYITHIDTIPSILKHGILCHKQAKMLPHLDISESGVQERRANKIIPNARALHEYANLYLDAHNPMLSKIRNINKEICILCIAPQILLQKGVIISDRNAARSFVRFYESPEGLEYLDESLIYAQVWKHSNKFEEDEHKGIKCAEVLVPERIQTKYIMGAYVYNKSAQQLLEQTGFSYRIEIKPNIFF